MSRRGRRPAVKSDGNTHAVNVKGQTYYFREGNDGRLRALGNPERGEDFRFAKEMVTGSIAQHQNGEEVNNDEG